MIARQAGPDDAEELVRLRAVMLSSLHHGGWSDDWRAPARQALIERLGSATLAAFVVDRPDDSGLAACALGTVEVRLGGPGDPAGRSGYVFSVATDPDMRRRGYSRRCVTALLEWFREQGIRRVDLKASPEGASLYRSLGFVPTPDPAMRLHL